MRYVTTYTYNEYGQVSSVTAVKSFNKIVDSAASQLTTIVDGKRLNHLSQKGGGSQSVKPTYKVVQVNAKCPEKETTDTTSDLLDALQTVLDWIGWIPGIGDICDGINAIISYLKNYLIDTLISVTCIVFTVAADALLKPLKNSKSIAKVLEVIQNKFGSGVSKISSWIQDAASFRRRR